MKNASILFIIFGIVTILFGLYVYRGHGYFVKPYNVNKDLNQLKKVGKGVMIVGGVILIISLVTYVLGDVP